MHLTKAHCINVWDSQITSKTGVLKTTEKNHMEIKWLMGLEKLLPWQAMKNEGSQPSLTCKFCFFLLFPPLQLVRVPFLASLVLMFS